MANPVIVGITVSNAAFRKHSLMQRLASRLEDLEERARLERGRLGGGRIPTHSFAQVAVEIDTIVASLGELETILDSLAVAGKE